MLAHATSSPYIQWRCDIVVFLSTSRCLCSTCLSTFWCIRIDKKMLKNTPNIEPYVHVTVIETISWVEGGRDDAIDWNKFNISNLYNLTYIKQSIIQNGLFDICHSCVFWGSSLGKIVPITGRCWNGTLRFINNPTAGQKATPTSRIPGSASRIFFQTSA